MFVMFKFNQNPTMNDRATHDKPDEFFENRPIFSTQGLCKYMRHDNAKDHPVSHIQLISTLTLTK